MLDFYKFFMINKQNPNKLLKLMRIYGNVWNVITTLKYDFFKKIYYYFSGWWITM